MRYFLLLLFIASNFTAWSQLNNLAFNKPLPIDPADSNKFYAGIQVMAFGKNDEYFHTLIDGYTLFGYQIHPTVGYRFRKNILLDAGLYLQKDFGNNKFTSALPTLSLKILHRDLSFTIGTLEGSLQHRLIEPLYDFERVLNRRIENGIQFQWIKDGLFMDGWVNWENMIYFNDPDQERFVAGLSLQKRLAKVGKWTFEIPFQTTVRHAGGQINAEPKKPLTSIFNSATGLTIEKECKGIIRSFGLKSYFLTYKSLTSRELPYKDGNAAYINPYMYTKWGFGMMGTYWYGNQFITFDGSLLFPVANELYPSIVHSPRSLYMLRFLYEMPLANGLILTARVEPFYDTLPKAIQYSYGFYLNFSDRFFLGNAKKK